jgi:hypothetical protein
MATVDRTAYYNDMLARLEEVLYQELSRCASWKMDFVGSDFLASKNIRGTTVEQIVDACIKEMEAGELVRDLKYKVGGLGILLKLDVDGCIHLPMEVKVREDGVKPYMCPIANMIVDRVVDKLHYVASHIAKIEINEDTGHCRIMCAIYENEGKIGQVSDWTKV